MHLMECEYLLRTPTFATFFCFSSFCHRQVGDILIFEGKLSSSDTKKGKLSLLKLIEILEINK